MKIKILSFVLLVTSLLISGQSRAFDCSKSSIRTQKLICEEESLIEMNSNFNSIYKNTIGVLSKKDKEALKRKIKSLLKVRDFCINSDQKLDSKNSVDNFLSQTNRSYSLKEKNFAQGCIATWYHSISSALLNQKNPSIFRIPSSEEYLKEFSKLKEKPYIFSVSEVDNDELRACKELYKNEPNLNYDCSLRMQNEYSEELTYTIFFLANGKNFIKIAKNSFSFDAGASHGVESGSLKFITEEGETQKINNSQYFCSIPIKDPVVINGDVYLPEQISFTKFFNGMLGEFNDSQCRTCSSYHADCLIRLSRIDNNKDSYTVFNERDFIEDPFEPVLNQNNKISLKDFRKCALDIIKKNQSDAGKIRNLYCYQRIKHSINFDQDKKRLPKARSERSCRSIAIDS